MAKMKVYELAKELSADSKDVMRVLQKKGITVKSHMSVLSENEVELVRAGLAGKKPAKAEQPAAPAGEFVPRVKRIPKAVVEAEAPAPAENTAAAAPAEKPAEKPAEAAKPVEKPVEAAKPAESEKPAPAEKPAEKPVEAAKPAATAKPAETEKPAEAAKP
ncbi:MAG: translation initiation factor IF-2 N-terminal domain-containing protein, partial [Firmicutes bacterium]|nr:translation initiation factor IF-2 N-terminal domain-containing protein [Bacillota bacterium]